MNQFLQGNQVSLDFSTPYNLQNKEITGTKNYPDIILCPFPAYNQDSLESHGYSNSFEFAQGINVEKKLVGWAGLGRDVRATLDNISIINHSNLCPSTVAVFLDQKGKVKEKKLQMKLTRAFFPTGRCCRAIVPEISRNLTMRKDFNKLINY